MGDYSRRAVRLLSLDGGGARGRTQLVLLRQVIYQLKASLGYAGDDIVDQNLYPCEFFDLITGSGTGGTNGIMVGRLGMNIAQCKEAWDSLGEVLHVQSGSNELLNAEKLETWAKSLVEKYTGNSETLMLVNAPPSEQNTNGKCCKVSVTAMRAQNIGMSTMFRTYRVRANQEYNCCIWEAIRATMSSPHLFKPIFIGKSWSKQEFINAELGANNPVSAMIEEKRKVWLRQGNWPPPEIGCIVSIGSGKGRLISMPSEQSNDGGFMSSVSGALSRVRFMWTPETPNTPRERELYDVMLRIAKDCERRHQQIKESYGRDEENVYHRFNVEQGMENVGENDFSKAVLETMNAQVNAYASHAELEIPFENVVRKLADLSVDYPRKRPLERQPTEPLPPYGAPEKSTYSNRG